MIRAFAYLRVSDPSQVKGDGFTRQAIAISDYAHAHDLRVVDTFYEQYTGTERDRPELARMLVSLQMNNHEVKTVIIEKLDRLAREAVVQELIIEDLKRIGVTLISTYPMEEDLCGSDSTRKLTRIILGAISGYQKDMLVQRMRAARDRKRALTGHCEGRPGYDSTTKGRSILRAIQTLMRRPKHGRKRTLKQIADRLNQDNMLTLDGREWTLHRVQQTINTYLK